MENDAIIYCENEFGEIDGKVANGLVRNSEKYNIVGVIDSSCAGLDAGEELGGKKNGIPIFVNLTEAIIGLTGVPSYFIYGIASSQKYINQEQRKVVKSALKSGMNIVNGLPEFFSEDDEFKQLALEHGVKIHDIRKPIERKYLHDFSGRILKVDVPVVAIMGTDCAIGKRTTAVCLVNALKEKGLKAIFIATGQTGLLQGAKYGIAMDVLSSGIATGELENVIVSAYENESPDIIIVEGQGALSHPSYTSSASILKGAKPDAVIIQDAPKREFHCDFPEFSLPSLEHEIDLIEAFSDTKVIAITINHEGMFENEIETEIIECEKVYDLPTTDVLTKGCKKLIECIVEKFPELYSK